MIIRNNLISLILTMVLAFPALHGQRGKHNFEVKGSEFILDRKPFQVISAGMAPARIPAEYWTHRIKMAKALGVNTITAEIFWNYHEVKEGEFDFESGNRNLAEFLQAAEDEKIFIILKTGPFAGAGWDNGGIPPYLLRKKEIRLRTPDAAYIAATDRYIAELAGVIKPFQVSEGGPVLMILTEDSENSDYVRLLKKSWQSKKIEIPVLTGKESIEDIALLPEGKQERCLHWGESKTAADTSAFLNSIRSKMKAGKSFNFILFGGSNFGYTSGACLGEDGYKPDITAWDLNAPVNDQGVPSAVYTSLREMFDSLLPKGRKTDEIPEPVKVFEIPALSMQPFTSIWDNLPQPVSTDNPGTFEDYGQDNGFILYRTEIKDFSAGKLEISGVHDFATVLIDGQLAGTIERSEGISTIDLPAGTTSNAVLEILVEAMGRTIPQGDNADRKGINGKVIFNGTVLTGWKIYNLPLDWKFIYGLRSTGKNLKKPGIFFKGNFSLIDKSDTYFDVSRYTKGVVWINGHNLGRFWNKGPQTRLYCPASWIKTGMNEIIIFDLVQTEARPFASFNTME